jgi:hypothetical protein
MDGQSITNQQPRRRLVVGPVALLVFANGKLLAVLWAIGFQYSDLALKSLMK